MESPIHPSTAGCCAFLRRPSCLSPLAYRPLPPVADSTDPPPPGAVRVVVGKERRVFLVDPFVLDRDPFRILMESAGGNENRKGAVFVDVDAILFEHMLWLADDDEQRSSSSAATLLHLNLKEIIEFYSQDC